MRAERGPTRYHYESPPCVVDVIEKEEGMSEDNNGKAPAAVPEVEAGLRFIHLMEVQGRMESRALRGAKARRLRKVPICTPTSVLELGSAAGTS